MAKLKFLQPIECTLSSCFFLCLPLLQTSPVISRPCWLLHLMLPGGSVSGIWRAEQRKKHLLGLTKYEEDNVVFADMRYRIWGQQTGYPVR